VTERGAGSEGAIGIAGAGRVGRAIGRLLKERGEPVVSVASRDGGRAREAAEFIGPGVTAGDYRNLAGVGRVLIAVADDAIEEVAGLVGKPRAALHTCGTKGPEALEALRSRGVSCGTIHPLQTFGDARRGTELWEGIAFAVSGEDAAREWAERIVGLAGGRVLRIAAEHRTLYHAAAVMAGNYTVALMAAGRTLLTAAGIEPGEALAALGPLARTSLENALRDGPEGALTGPIERGDAGTVQAHLEALAESRCLRELYKAAGIQALELARKKGLGGAQAAAIEDILR
jgi:predicted short-subunit dehydrogenase-like oxidoreductase (DUF2520 family)